MGMGFPYRFVNWIMECVSTVSYTIKVNGELTEPFRTRRGLRQGDPVSPYLFLLCMEYLNRSLLELRENRLFHFHPKYKRFNLIHLCFVDDLLLFAKGDLLSVQQLMEVFGKISRVSGLKMNPQKSCIYFEGVREAVKEDILQATGMSQGQLPFMYLGVTFF